MPINLHSVRRFSKLFVPLHRMETNMSLYNNTEIEKTQRITKLIEHLYEKMPEIESARAKLITESFKQTESEDLIIRKAKAFMHILKNIPIIIRENELIVGSATIAPRGCQTFPEFSYEWLEKEFDTVATRSADPFYIADTTKKELLEANAYWKGKTTSELAYSFMAEETIKAMDANVFTVGNYYYNGVGHICVQYDKVLAIGYSGIKDIALKEKAKLKVSDGDYAERESFLRAVIISCDAAISYAERYAQLAQKQASECADETRKQELLQIALNCKNVPKYGAKTFYEACQSFWFVQHLIQVESSGHSISPGRFDQYMYPYYEKDLKNGKIEPHFAQELIDCIWVKLNDLNKCRDAVSAEGFAGYSLFQNLIVGGQTVDGKDATNELSFMCIRASKHVFLPQPSLSIRVWNGSSHELLVAAADLTRTGIGLPAYYNDEVMIESLMSRGLTLAEARDYCIIGCVEPQIGGKTHGWHDAAFFNMCRPMELVFSNGKHNGKLISVQTGDVAEFKTYEEFFNAYKKQMEYQIALLVNADNAVDLAHQKRAPLPFLACMVDDCIKTGKTAERGGAKYNFTGPQGFGIANMADALFGIKKLVFEENEFTIEELKKVLELNYGKGFSVEKTAEITKEIAKNLMAEGYTLSEGDIELIAKNITQSAISDADKQLCDKIFNLLDKTDKFGNDIDEVDDIAREVAYLYTKPLETFKNPRGGVFQAGLYPVSANVPLGAQTGATPDARLAFTPVADGVSPSAGRDTNGPTAACNSVAKLDHCIASNGTLFNQKFHPSALSGVEGIEKFIALIRGFFDKKGMHVQFNVVNRDTLIDAQKNPEKYKGLVVRVAGYSALFTTLSRSLQDDIIGRTEQGM